MYTVHNQYHLKRSRLAIVFQLSILFILSFILYFALDPSVWVVSLLLFGLSILFFHRSPSVESLQHLDQQYWSVKFKNQHAVERICISHFIDHSLYIVVYIANDQQKNIVIWRDQLDIQYWKSLKLHAKLN